MGHFSEFKILSLTLFPLMHFCHSEPRNSHTSQTFYEESPERSTPSPRGPAAKPSRGGPRHPSNTVQPRAASLLPASRTGAGLPSGSGATGTAKANDLGCLRSSYGHVLVNGSEEPATCFLTGNLSPQSKAMKSSQYLPTNT